MRWALLRIWYLNRLLAELEGPFRRWRLPLTLELLGHPAKDLTPSEAPPLSFPTRFRNSKEALAKRDPRQHHGPRVFKFGMPVDGGAPTWAHCGETRHWEPTQP